MPRLLTRRQAIAAAAGALGTAGVAHMLVRADADEHHGDVMVCCLQAEDATLLHMAPPAPPPPERCHEQHFHSECHRGRFYIMDARSWIVAGPDGEARYPLVELMRDPTRPIAVLSCDRLEPLGWFPTREAAIAHIGS